MEFSDNSYKALPDCLTIKESPIHRLGLFATRDISMFGNIGTPNQPLEFQHMLCKSHLVIKTNNRDYLFRLESGAYINHSDIPNITLQKSTLFTSCTDITINVYTIVLLRDIKAGEELTLNYSKEFCGKEYKTDDFIILKDVVFGDHYVGDVTFQKSVLLDSNSSSSNARLNTSTAPVYELTTKHILYYDGKVNILEEGAVFKLAGLELSKHTPSLPFITKMISFDFRIVY